MILILLNKTKNFLNHKLLIWMQLIKQLNRNITKIYQYLQSLSTTKLQKQKQC